MVISRRARVNRKPIATKVKRTSNGIETVSYFSWLNYCAPNLNAMIAVQG